MRKVRISSWEMDGHLFAAVEAAKVKRGAKWTWRRMQSEGLRLLLASWGEPVTLPPDEDGEGGAHASPVERVPPVAVDTQSPAVGVPAAGLPAAGVPAAVAVELSENEKRLERLIRGRAQKQYYLDEAPRELEREPGSLRALNWLARMPGILASYDADIEACRAEIEAEKAAKENGGETLEGAEV